MADITAPDDADGLSSGGFGLEQPILFAHRGGMAHGPENEVETFRGALAKGVGGLESDVHLTADNVAVIHHDPALWRRLRRFKISRKTQAQLPSSLLTLEDFYRRLGCDFEFSLDIKPRDRSSPERTREMATQTTEVVVGVAAQAEQDAGSPVLSRLWLCHPDWELLAGWRERWPEVKLANSIRLGSVKDGFERRMAQLSSNGIEVVNMPYRDWSHGRVVLAHRFEILAFGWDAHYERSISELMRFDIDAIYGDNVDNLLDFGRRSLS